MFISDMWNNWKTFKKNISNDHKDLSSITCLNTPAFKRHSDNGKADDQQKIPSNVQANKKKVKNKGKCCIFNLLKIDWEVIGLEFMREIYPKNIIVTRIVENHFRKWSLYETVFIILSNSNIEKQFSDMVG